MALSDRDVIIVQTMVMRLDTKAALEWLKGHGYEMGESTYFKIKSELREKTMQRKFELAREGLWEQHLERIDQLETILKLSWENAINETKPLRNQRILESIALLQPLLSAYYGATQGVIEHDTAKDKLYNKGSLPIA